MTSSRASLVLTVTRRRSHDVALDGRCNRAPLRSKDEEVQLGEYFDFAGA